METHGYTAAHYLRTYGPLMSAGDVAHVLRYSCPDTLLRAIRRGSVQLRPRYQRNRKRVMFSTDEVIEVVNQILGTHGVAAVVDPKGAPEQAPSCQAGHKKDPGRTTS